MINIDKIFFICNVSNKERVENVNSIVNILNLQNYVINYITPLVKLYNDEHIVNDLKRYFVGATSNKHIVNGFDCYINHYNIIGEAYYNNYDSILVCEDDLTINNIDTFKELLTNIPSDADFIQFAYDYNIYKNNQNQNIISEYNNYYNKITNLNTYSTMCYFCSKKTIHYLFEYYSNNVVFSDAYQYYNVSFMHDLNLYIPKYTILDVLKFKSTFLN